MANNLFISEGIALNFLVPWIGGGGGIFLLTHKVWKKSCSWKKSCIPPIIQLDLEKSKGKLTAKALFG